MRTRSLLIAASAAVILATTMPMPAHAKTTESVDRRLFDATPERTAASMHLEGATAGPLGGAMDLTVSAPDGTLPTALGSCEPADVTAVVTVSPGELLTVTTEGEACAHVISGALQVNAFFDAKDLRYTGTEHKKVKLVGDGLIAAADQVFGGLASFSATVRW